MSGPWEKYADQGPWTAYKPKPKLGEFDMPFELSGRQFKTALGMLTTFDDKKQLSVLKENYPDLQFMQDEEGNIIVDGSAYNAGSGYLNKPGVSARDLLQVGFNVAAFTPAGKAITATTAVGRMGQAAAASGAIQAGIEGINAATGGGLDVADSAENILISSAFGGAAEGLFSGIAPRIAPAIAKWRMSGKVTPDIQESVRIALLESGVPAAQINEKTILSAIQTVAKQSGKKIGQVTSSMLDDAVASSGVTGLPLTPTPFRAARNQMLSEEFDVPLTRGQVTEDIGQLLTEDNLRNAAMGDGGAQIIRAFDDAQTQKLNAARTMIQGRLSGGEPQIARAADGLGMASDGIRAAERAMDAQVDAAYGAVRDAFMSPQGVRGLVQRVRQSVRGVEFIPSLPQTANVLDDGAKLTKLIDSMGGKLKPWHIKQLEAFRRRLGAGIDAATDNQDRRQVTIMKRAFDEYMDKAIDGALLSGDDGAMEALKSAREIRTAYAKKFQPQPARSRVTGREFRDEAGELVDRIIYANPTSEEVANALFGSAKLSKGASPRVASRFKKILGDSSAEWNAIREAAFLRLTGAGEGMQAKSAQVFMKNLDEAIYGDGAPLMRELFTDSEIKLFKRYAALMKKTDPFGGPQARARFNASGTSYANNRNVLNLLSYLIRGAGATGDPAAMASASIMETMTGQAGKSAARQATQEITPKVPVLPFNRFSASGLPISFAQEDMND